MIIHGAILLKNLKLQRAIFYLDSAKVVDLINSGNYYNHPHVDLIEYAINFLNDINGWSVSHVCREFNSAADALARFKSTLNLGSITLGTPPFSFVTLLGMIRPLLVLGLSPFSVVVLFGL